MKLGLSEPSDLLSRVKENKVCKKSTMAKEGNNLYNAQSIAPTAEHWASFFSVPSSTLTFSLWMYYSLAKCEYMFMRCHRGKTHKQEMPVSSFPSLPFDTVWDPKRKPSLLPCQHIYLRVDWCGLDYPRVKLPLKNLLRGKKGGKRGGKEGEEYMKMRHQLCSSSAGW